MIEESAYQKVMEEIIELSAALDLGEFVSPLLLTMSEFNLDLAHVFRDVVSAGSASEKEAIFRVYPGDGLICVLTALRTVNADRASNSHAVSSSAAVNNGEATNVK